MVIPQIPGGGNSWCGSSRAHSALSLPLSVSLLDVRAHRDTLSTCFTQMAAWSLSVPKVPLKIIPSSSSDRHGIFKLAVHAWATLYVAVPSPRDNYSFYRSSLVGGGGGICLRLDSALCVKWRSSRSIPRQVYGTVDAGSVTRGLSSGPPTLGAGSELIGQSFLGDADQNVLAVVVSGNDT